MVVFFHFTQSRIFMCPQIFSSIAPHLDVLINILLTFYLTHPIKVCYNIPYCPLNMYYGAIHHRHNFSWGIIITISDKVSAQKQLFNKESYVNFSWCQHLCHSKKFASNRTDNRKDTLPLFLSNMLLCWCIMIGELHHSITIQKAISPWPITEGNVGLEKM